jgi:hypothetical protein
MHGTPAEASGTLKRTMIGGDLIRSILVKGFIF